MRTSTMKRLAFAAMLVVGLWAIAGNANAADWRPTVTSCVKTTSPPAGCTAGAESSGLWNLVVGPGGTTAYGTAWNSNTVLIFDRDPATGKLTQRNGAAGCIQEQDAASAACGAARGIHQPDDIVISPNGRQLYVSAWNNFSRGSIATFNRDLTTGALTYVGCISNDGSSGGAAGKCTDGRGIAGARSLVISPDGANLYSGPNGAIAAFSRDSNGVLHQLDGTAGCIQETPVTGDNCADATGLLGEGRQFAITPDGTSVYVASWASNSVVTLKRDSAGALSQATGTSSCMSANGYGGLCSTDPRLVSPSSTLSSADGRQIYVSTGNGIVVYSRAGDGKLTFQSCVNDLGDNGCGAARAVRDLYYMALSPDGQDLVANVNSHVGGFTVLSRDPGTGNLSQRAGTSDVCMSVDGAALDNGAVAQNVCLKHPGAGDDGHVAFASNDLLYAAAYLNDSTGAVLAVKRNFYPTCPDQSLAVPHNTSIAVGFDCSDRNGDAIAAYNIAANPISGILGGIDQAGGRVFYNPFSGFSGGDSFQYTASAGGLTSRVTTISLSVAAPPGGGGGGGGGGVVVPGGIDGDKDGFFAGQDCNDASAAIRPGAVEVRGNRIDENCDGLAEPFPTLTSGVVTSWDVKGSKLTLKGLQVTQLFPKGWSVQIKCSGKKCPFKSKKLKPGKVKRSASNVIGSLSTKQRKFRPGQTIEVWVSAPSYNTKVSRYVLKKGKIPTTQPFCVLPGQTKPQKTCT